MRKLCVFYLLLMLAATAAHGQMKIDGVVNSASGTARLAPGTWAALYGSGLAAAAVTAQSVPFPTTLGGVQVTVAGKAAPLSYVSPTQINLLIPFEAASLNPGLTATAALVVSNAGTTSLPVNLTLIRNAPAIFTKNSQGFGPALAFDASFREISAVGAGAIVIYATGLGPVTPPASSGATGAATEPLNRLLDGLTVMVGDTAVVPSFVGLAPFLHGIYQVNFTPPSPRPASLSLLVGGVQSNISSLLVAAGSNVTNLSGSIDGLYPATGPWVERLGGPSRPITISAMLFSAAFELAFDILPGAKPFQVVSRGPVGGVTINFDPPARTYTASVTLPQPTARVYNFSTSDFSVLDFANCTVLRCLPFPYNLVPQSRLDPVAVRALSNLPGNPAAATGANGLAQFSGTIPADGHIVIGPDTHAELSRFGGFRNLTYNQGPDAGFFDLYVDNVPVASKAAAYSILNPFQ
jgi:uncharacterized protein (TIGR03437 family)